MKKLIFLGIILSLIGWSWAQNANCYRVYLSNKNNSPFSTDHPEEFLSPRAIAKRTRFNIPITIQDLPVNPSYINQIKAFDPDIRVLATSKWLNTVVIYCPNPAHLPGIQNLGGVQYLVPVANWELNPPAKEEQSQDEILDQKSTNSWRNLDYGNSIEQIAAHRGDLLHDEGFRGEGMLIAVFDAGWNNFNTISYFQPLYQNGQIWGTYDFVPNLTSVYTGHSHGTSVTSIMASNIDGELIGTAPEANYFFIRSEIPYCEQLIEEDFWVAAAEMADSLGADVINSSLGYTTFPDFPQGDLTPQDNDGVTGVSSQAATIAGEKGIVVVISAGNEGWSECGFIGRPADAIDVLSVGAMNKDSIIAPFSSYGPSADGRVKPDITSVGWDTWHVTENGDIMQGSGTSFSGPVIAGLSACLWQALPHLSSTELMQVVREASHLYNNPNIYFGYGIPDFYQAFLDNSVSIFTYPQETVVSAYPNPVADQITFYSSLGENMSVTLFDYTGRNLGSWRSEDPSLSISLTDFPSGIYLARVTIGSHTETIKLIKR